MDICIGDIVKNNEGDLGIVKLIDGIAVWVSWLGSGEIDFSSGFKLRVISSASQ